MKRLLSYGIFALAIQGCLVLSSPVAAAGGDGPRAYALIPAGTNVARFMFVSLDGNQSLNPGTALRKSEIDVNAAAFQFVRAFDLNGSSFAPFFVLSYGTVEGSVELQAPLPGRLSGDERGLFDLQVGAVYGFLGSPALTSPAEFAAHEPGLQMGVLAKAFLPIGAYESDRVLNPGSNRYALQIGLPTTLAMGASLLDRNFSSIEVLPSIIFFGDNDDPFGNAGETSQEHLFTLETHYTRNFGRSFWASLDAFYEYGGETRSDGVSNDDKQESFSLGASANFVLPNGMNVQASYGEVLWNNQDGAEGRQFRLSVISTF